MTGDRGEGGGAADTAGGAVGTAGAALCPAGDFWGDFSMVPANCLSRVELEGESRCEMTDDGGGKDRDIPKEGKAVGEF